MATKGLLMSMFLKLVGVLLGAIVGPEWGLLPFCCLNSEARHGSRSAALLAGRGVQAEPEWRLGLISVTGRGGGDEVEPQRGDALAFG
jgi:hypothetical protein